MNKLKISNEISLPTDAVTQTFAMIGRKGAGKTYLASMVAEQMLDNHAQTIVLDCVGVWWGLRVAADGKSKGKDIFVIGGEHGDIPIIPEAGAKIAKLLVEKGISAVLDISGFRIGELKRFAADFAEEFFHLKKSHRSPVHVFIEEAQKIIPQRVGPDEARMVGAFEQIVRLGRNYGIGASLITQRPQSVNKEVLSQVECLCVLQVTGPHERKALEEWVYEAGAERALVGELPGLKRGEGYVWSPSWLRIYKRVEFSQKQTFDASATPVVGQKVKKAASLSKMDVEKIKNDMSDIVAQVEKDNPVALRKKITSLEADLKKKISTIPDKTIYVHDKRETEKATALAEAAFKVHEMGMVKQISAAKATIQKLFDDIILKSTFKPMKPITNNSKKILDMIILPGGKIKNIDKFTFARETNYVDQEGASIKENKDFTLSNPQQKILDALSWFEAIGIHEVSKTQAAFIAEVRPTSGGYANNLSILKSNRLITYPKPNHLKLTEQGFASAFSPERMGTIQDLHDTIQKKVSKPQWTILSTLIEIYPGEITKTELAEKINVQATSGGYANNLSILRSLALIDYPSPGSVIALPILFLE